MNQMVPNPRLKDGQHLGSQPPLQSVRPECSGSYAKRS